MENLDVIVKHSVSYKEVMEFLGWNINGSNYKKVKELIINHGLTTEHFIGSSELMKIYNLNKKITSFDDILVEDSDYTNRTSLKKRLIKSNLLEYKCFKCGNEGEWMGETISLILDHINGVNNDNRIENLRFACPNCNATLDTHCGKNIKNEKNKKTPKELPVDFFIRKNEVLRKVERPSYEILKKEIEELGYSATGRKYSVSDNSIRKWLKTYEKLNNGSIV